VRAALGIYLLVHFAQLIPWGTELFSSDGMLDDAALSPLYPLFPNILFVADSPAAVTALLIAAIALSVLLIVGRMDRSAAVGIWYVWACLYGRNPLISNPSIPYVGWMLLAHAAMPPGPRGSLEGRRRPELVRAWRYPPSLFAAAWIVMSVGYTYSGYCKLTSPSWLDGTALLHVLNNPLARPNALREYLLTAPALLLQLGSWGGLLLELLFAPLALRAGLRPLLWLAMLTMHVVLMMLVDFPDLSQGMLLLHAFTFDPAWIARYRDRNGLPDTAEGIRQ
jgi:hypothetical protein